MASCHMVRYGADLKPRPFRWTGFLISYNATMPIVNCCCKACAFTAAPDFPLDPEAPGYSAAGAALHEDWDDAVAAAELAGDTYVVHIADAPNWTGWNRGICLEDAGCPEGCGMGGVTYSDFGGSYSPSLPEFLALTGGGKGLVVSMDATNASGLPGFAYQAAGAGSANALYATHASEVLLGSLMMLGYRRNFDGSYADATFTDVRLILGTSTDYPNSTLTLAGTISYEYDGGVGPIPVTHAAVVGPLFDHCSLGGSFSLFPHWAMFWFNELGGNNACFVGCDEITDPFGFGDAPQYKCMQFFSDSVGDCGPYYTPSSPVIGSGTAKFCWQVRPPESGCDPSTEGCICNEGSNLCSQYFGHGAETKGVKAAVRYTPSYNFYDLTPCPDSAEAGASNITVKTGDVLSDGDEIRVDFGDGLFCYTVMESMETTGTTLPETYAISGECGTDLNCPRLFTLTPCADQPDTLTHVVWTRDPLYTGQTIETTLPGETEPSKYTSVSGGTPAEFELPAWVETTCVGGLSCVTVQTFDFGGPMNIDCDITGATPAVGQCVTIPDGAFGPFTGTVFSVVEGGCIETLSWNGPSTWVDATGSC